MTLTTAQLQTLKAAINAEADPTFVALRAAGATGAMAEWYNGASTFVAWRTNVTRDETGNAWVGTDIDGMSALNMQRLQLMLATSTTGSFDMSRSDRRAGFENPFGTNVNNGSRVAMRAVWKRFATRFERLFTTGTGTDNTPGLLVVEGTLTNNDIVLALGV
jgi:hypothetical protein